MKWVGGFLLALVVLIGIGWLFRAELALFGINRMMASRMEVGPTQEVRWSTGSDPEGRDPSNRPPNIVLILADDLGWNDVSMNGPNATTQTPNIDALAAEGVTFSQGYAANGTCAPSRAALMAGRYGTRFGFEFTPTPTGFMPIVGLVSETIERPLLPPAVRNPESSTLSYDEMGMPPSEITLAELLADQGYHTAHIGKWHLGRQNGMAAHDQGFAESLLMASGLYGRRLTMRTSFRPGRTLIPIDRFLWAALRLCGQLQWRPGCSSRPGT